MSESTSNKAGVIVIALSILAIVLILNSDKDPQGELDRVRKIQLQSEIERLDAIYNPYTAPTSSELISELEQAAKTLIEPSVAVDPAPSPSDKPKVAKREIVIFSADWCEPCQRWKRCEQSKFEQAGYTFAYGNPDDISRLPHFIVVDGDKTVEISGYMTLDRLNAELAK